MQVFLLANSFKKYIGYLFANDYEITGSHKKNIVSDIHWVLQIALSKIY